MSHDLKIYIVIIKQFSLPSGAPGMWPAGRFSEYPHRKKRPADCSSGESQCHQSHLVLGKPGGEDYMSIGEPNQNNSAFSPTWVLAKSELLICDLMPQGCQYLQHTCTSPLKTLCLFSQNNEQETDWTHPSILEEMWRNAVEWKSIWIPTAWRVIDGNLNMFLNCIKKEWKY